MRLRYCLQSRFPVSGDASVLFAVFFIWAITFVSFDFHVDYPPRNDDDLMYLTLGKSFYQGQGYQNIALPTQENTFLAPSGFPLLLSFYWFFKAPILALKFFLALFLIAGVWLSFIWLTLFIPRIEAFLIALAFASLPEFIMVSNGVMTEILFIPVFYLALIFSAQFIMNRYQGKSGWLATLCWVVLARTRVVGIVFLLTFFILLIVKKQWLKSAVAGLLFIGWLLLEKALIIKAAIPFSYGKSELGQLHALFANPHRFLNAIYGFYKANIEAFASSYYAKYFFPYFYHIYPMTHAKLLLTLGIFCVGLSGALCLWKTKPFLRFTLAAAAIMAGIIFRWDAFGALNRYLFPFYPLMILAFVYAFHCAAKKIPFLCTTRITLILCLLVAANNGFFSAEHFDPWTENWWDREHMLSVHEYINRLSSKPQLLLSSINRYSYLKTGIHSVLLSDSLNIKSLCLAIGAKNVLVVEREIGNQIGPWWRKPPGILLTRKGHWALYALNLSAL